MSENGVGDEKMGWEMKKWRVWSGTPRTRACKIRNLMV